MKPLWIQIINVGIMTIVDVLIILYLCGVISIAPFGKIALAIISVLSIIVSRLIHVESKKRS